MNTNELCSPMEEDPPAASLQLQQLWMVTRINLDMMVNDKHQVDESVIYV